MRETHIHLTKAHRKEFNSLAGAQHSSSVTRKTRRPHRLSGVLLLISIALVLVVATRITSTVDAASGSSSGSSDGKTISVSANRQSALAPQLKTLGQLPLQFEKNKGQAISRVKFVAR